MTLAALVFAALVFELSDAPLIPVAGGEAALSRQGLELVWSGDTPARLDLTPLTEGAPEDWRLARVTCGAPDCSWGFAGISHVFDTTRGRLAGFDRRQGMHAHLLIRRGYYPQTRIAPLTDTTALLLSPGRVLFDRPGPCGTRACQSLSASLSMVMRSGPANWAPHTGLRLYETAATQTGLFALSRGAGHVLVQEIEADSINWTLFDPFSGPRPVDLPAGPVFASHEGRVLFDANPGGDAATFGLMPGHCITNGCEDSEIIHFAPLTPDRQTPALSLGGDGRLFMIRWEDGASVLYSAPAEPGGAFSKVGGAPQGVHLQFEVLAGFSGVGLSAQAPAGDRRWIHLEIRDGETFIHDLALQPSWFEVRTSSGRAQSADGQAIPYTLFEPLEPASDPCAPLLVHVYGGYGAPSQPRPLFGAERQWIENGGRVAIAHVRGDGAFGAEWAALGESDRWRTIEDLLGVIRHFHEAGLAAPSSTLITGGSFGGALVLAAAAHAPDRIAGADAGSPPLRGGTLDESLTAYLALDPPLQGRLEGMPVLIRAGSHDRVTSPDDLQAWRAILSRNGAEVTALIFDGLPHEWRGSDHPAGHAAEARIASWMLERVTPETACMP